ncbi:DUF1772-domain-containing protein [Aureobasidium pullulans]|nr:DUF1772-domain-containing protein [Aureobasidium pullulans]
MSTIHTVAKLIGLTSAAWLSDLGNISALSLISVPAVATVKAESKLSNGLAVRIWEQNYELGKSQNPLIALTSATSLGFLAWSLRGLRTVSVVGLRPTPLFAIAALSTFGLMPFTIAFMMGTNNKLLKYAEKAKKDDLSVTETEDVDGLLKRWTFLNGVRGLFPLAGAVAAGIAIVA